MASLIVSDKAEAFGYNNVCVAGVNCIKLLGDTPVSPKDKSERKREKYKVGAENPDTPMLDTKTSNNGTKEYCDIIVYTLNTQAWDEALTQHYENLPSYKVDSRDISGGVLRSVSCNNEAYVSVTLYGSTNKFMVHKRNLYFRALQ